jgi:hypothetical protein
MRTPCLRRQRASDMVRSPMLARSAQHQVGQRTGDEGGVRLDQRDIDSAFAPHAHIAGGGGAAVAAADHHHLWDWRLAGHAGAAMVEASVEAAAAIAGTAALHGFCAAK